MALAWSALLLLCLVLYVLLDGYDLGIGVAMLFERDRRHRTVMLLPACPAALGPTWSTVSLG